MNKSNTPSGEYGADEIQVFKDLDHVRKRPAMYIGDTDVKGFHHLVYEVLDNSVDEAMAGHCDTIKVLIDSDGRTITIEDNGRGIPVALHAAEKKSTLEVVLSIIGAGGKFGGSGYQAAGGLHGVGVSCVNALSDRLDARVWRSDKNDKDNYGEHTVSYCRGRITAPVTKVSDKTTKRGTAITFSPDPEIFKTCSEFDEETICTRLRETAYLNAGLKIQFVSKRTGRKEEFFAQGGIGDYVSYLNAARSNPFPNPVFYAEKSEEAEKFLMQIAFQYSDDGEGAMLSFANNIKTHEGGRHLSGWSQALTRCVNAFARKLTLLKEKENNLTPEEIQKGMMSIISVRLPQPQFEGQTKTKLGTSEVQGWVTKLAYEALTDYFDKNPITIKRIVERGLLIRKANQRAKAAYTETVGKGPTWATSIMPNKLSDCKIKGADAELFIVEGDSAKGSGERGRDPLYQAIMPIRGKIANTEKNDIDMIVQNAEIKALISAIGTSILETFKLEKLRYGKIIIMTDADDDGCHIRSLLLSFFYRYMRPLIENGHIYLAQPPLYRIRVGDDDHYVQTQKEYDVLMKKFGSKASVTRFKGLGEMMAGELGDTTMKPGVRQLIQVTMEDMDEAVRMLSVCMGSVVGPRKDHLIKRAAQRSTNIALEVI